MTPKSPPVGDPLEPDLSFEHARWKVRWASEHIKHLNAWCNKFVQEHANSPVAYSNAQGGLVLAPPSVTPFVALRAGDAIFSLRSALDCCWMGLKRAAYAKAKKDTLPRADTRHGVEGELKKASVEHAFKGADRFILNKIRPYEDGNEALWFLAKADNWNKHNMLLATLARSTVNGTFKPAVGGHITFVDCKIEAGGPFTFIGGPALSDSTHDFQTGTPPEIVIGLGESGSTRPLVPFLVSALQQTHEAVEAFASTFGKNAPKAVQPEAEA